MQNVIRIALWTGSLIEWGGGREVIYNLLRIFYKMSSQKKEYSFSVVIDRQVSDEQLVELNDTIEKIFPRIPRYYFESTYEAKCFLQKIYHPTICLPVTSNCLRNVDFEVVSYIPDIQEEYLKRYFSKREIVFRRTVNSYILKRAKYVMVFSPITKQMIIDKYSVIRCKIECQPCLPMVCDDYYDTSYVDLSKYDLPSRYFFMGSQFWQHKNHITAFEALYELVENEDIDVSIVCTGKMDDYRDPIYFDKIIEFVKSRDLENKIHFLGYIPKCEQLEIMKRSYAVVQPTLFEGGAGGFVAQEAIALGRPLLVSNIPVNMELKSFADVYLFASQDSHQLAKLMKSCLEKGLKEYSKDDAMKISKENCEKLSLYYTDLFERIVHNSGKQSCECK